MINKRSAAICGAAEVQRVTENAPSWSEVHIPRASTDRYLIKWVRRAQNSRNKSQGDVERGSFTSKCDPAS
jgi:hypothetical protein